MEKPSLSFYTNIPAPYQLAFFNSLADYFDLTVIYYSLSQNGNNWKLDPKAKYRTQVLSNNFIAKVLQKFIPDFHFSWEIFKTVKADTSQYVVVGGGYANPNSAVALFTSKRKKKQVAYFSEALFPAPNGFKRSLKKWVLNILNCNCDYIFCTGKKAVESFDYYGVRPEKFVIPYNIDISSFLPESIEPARKLALIEKHGIGESPVILSSGFLIARKGMDILIEAVKGIKQDFHLIIIGGGELLSELEALAGGDSRISFAGFQTSADIPYFFNIADIFVLASRYDGWGVVINEALAANVPVISSDTVGAAVELITSGENGLVCKSEDVQAFREAILSLLVSPAERDRLKRNAAALVPRVSSDYNARSVYNIFTG